MVGGPLLTDCLGLFREPTRESAFFGLPQRLLIIGASKF